MSVQKMIYWVKKNRVLMLVLFAILIASLVITFALTGNNMGNYNNGGQISAEEKIAAYDEQLVEVRAAYEAASDDYSAITSLAALLLSRGDAYLEMGDQEAAVKDYKEAGDMYYSAFENQPENLNAAGQSSILVKAAIAYEYSGEVASSEKCFLKAIAIDPESSNVVSGYATLLLSTGRVDEAISYVSGMVDEASTEEKKADFQGFLDTLNAIKEAMENNADANAEQAGDDAGQVDEEK